MTKTNSAHATVLIVDDEGAVRESLRMILEFDGYGVEEVADGVEALDWLMRHSPDAVLLDVKMPRKDGMQVLEEMQERGHRMPVVMISGHADVSTAVEATRRGAWDFLEKPLQRERVLLALRNSIESYRLQREGAGHRAAPDRLIGSSPAMRVLRQTIEKAGPTTATVLITGESGTGKELVARAIHEASPRAKGELIQVNCAAIPDELIESELFGHEKGSFTGAIRKQQGKFVSADKGTIFLDEVGDMSKRTQAKVLRVLQSGEVEPVGAERTFLVDVRVVAATNRDLEEEIAEGRFREDLFYRLNVIPIRTPPLRERLDDLPILVEYFVRRFAENNNYRAKEFTTDALEHLAALPWRGNVRELRNLVERLLILSAGDRVDRHDLVTATGEAQQELSRALVAIDTLKEFRELSERFFLIRKLEENEWNVTRTAKAVQTPRSNLYKKMEQYDIRRRSASSED